MRSFKLSSLVAVIAIALGGCAAQVGTPGMTGMSGMGGMSGMSGMSGMDNCVQWTRDAKGAVNCT